MSTYCIIVLLDITHDREISEGNNYTHGSKITGKFYRSSVIHMKKCSLWAVMPWTYSDCEAECCLNCLYIFIVTFFILLLGGNRTNIFVSQLSRKMKTVCLLRKIFWGSPYGLVQFTHFKLNFLLFPWADRLIIAGTR